MTGEREEAMSHPESEPTARQLLALTLQLLGVPTDDERLAQLAERTAALLADGDRLSGRAAPEVEPMVAQRLPGADGGGDR